jgi:hypothetical protein
MIETLLFNIENLDWLILIMKNWPNNPISTCMANLRVKSMEECLDVEDFLLEENEELIVDFGFFE